MQPPFPLEVWAAKNPRVRWPLLLAFVFFLSWLGSVA